tara:strand:+ start:51 stop:218 length:168 start_codon:yes stop_codon:yes gene_type:complete
MGFDLQFIPIYGCSLGVLYYSPDIDPSNEDDDMYHQLTFMFLIFGIHITWWKFLN